MLRLSPTMSNKVLCVDKDAYLTDLLHYALTRDGYTVEVGHIAAEAVQVGQTAPPNLAILDAHLPDVDGFTLCGRLSKTFHLPVVMLITGARDADVLKAFEAGADDCLAKPFSMQILSYRIGAVLRRSAQSTPLSGPMRLLYRLGSGTFHAEEHIVTGRLGPVRLTATQGKILRLLLENDGRVLSAEQIMTKVWQYETESDVHVVKSHLSNLRKSLAAALGDEEVIRTVAGVGYTMHKAVLEQVAVWNRILPRTTRSTRHILNPVLAERAVHRLEGNSPPFVATDYPATNSVAGMRGRSRFVSSSPTHGTGRQRAALTSSMQAMGAAHSV